MSDFLQIMEQSSRDRLEASRRSVTLGEMRERAAAVAVNPLTESAFHLFAEIKPESPAEGVLEVGDPVVRAKIYQEAGATGISVLTEPRRFGGSLESLQGVAAAVATPVLRKDFLIDPYQVWESRASGADGVLLIARMFDSTGMAEMASAVREAGVFAIVEVFDEGDLDLLEVFADDSNVLVGVNSRDLSSLQVRPAAHERLVAALPPEIRWIAESGISTPERVVELQSMGYDGVLVGTSLMRSPDPGLLIRQMLQAVAR